METPEMMDAWLAEIDRIRSKKDARGRRVLYQPDPGIRLGEEPPIRQRSLLGVSATTIEMYLSGNADEAIATFSSAQQQGME